MRVNQYIAVEQLFPHPDNPRKDLGDLTELADSIRGNGVYQNLTVVPQDESMERYTVIIGHRRLAAAKLAGVRELPCVITEMSKEQQVSTMLLENMQRSDLTAYEQAQGFQLLLNFGMSVEEMSRKTGFSATTVRRRLKMTELDADRLKAASGRQLALGDFDKLSAVENIDRRNDCLDKIGTADFERELRGALRWQAIDKNLPLVKAEIERIKAKKIIGSQRWSGKYNKLKEIVIEAWAGQPLIEVTEDEKGQAKPLYYYLDEGWGRLEFYRDAPKTKRQQVSPAERELRQRVSEAWRAADLAADMAWQLRWDFMATVKLTPRNTEAVLRGAVTLLSLKSVSYIHDTASKETCNFLGIEDGYLTAPAQAVAALAALPADRLPQAVYLAWDDSKAVNFLGQTTRLIYPAWHTNPRLDALYDWLISLGYEMSGEELALRDGSHELLHRGDKS